MATRNSILSDTRWLLALPLATGVLLARPLGEMLLGAPLPRELAGMELPLGWSGWSLGPALGGDWVVARGLALTLHLGAAAAMALALARWLNIDALLALAGCTTLALLPPLFPHWVLDPAAVPILAASCLALLAWHLPIGFRIAFWAAAAFLAPLGLVPAALLGMIRIQALRPGARRSPATAAATLLLWGGCATLAFAQSEGAAPQVPDAVLRPALLTGLGVALGAALARRGSVRPEILIPGAIALVSAGCFGTHAASRPLAATLFVTGGGLILIPAWQAARGQRARHLLIIAGLGVAALASAQPAREFAAAAREPRSLTQAFQERASRIVQRPAVTDLVAGLRSRGHGVLVPHLAALWSHDQVAAIDGIPLPAAGARVRIHRWEADLPPGMAPVERHRLASLFDGLVATDRELRLEAPAHDHAGSIQEPDAEPIFRWSLPKDLDPGPDAFRFVGWATSNDHPNGGLRMRRLDETVLEREILGERVHYAWRPSLRSQAGHIAVRELYWEDGDLVHAGHPLTWTITWTAAHPEPRFLIATPSVLRAQ